MVAAVLSLLRPALLTAAAIEPAGCHRLRRAATGCHNRPLLYTPGVALRRLARPRHFRPVLRRWAAHRAGGVTSRLLPVPPARPARPAPGSSRRGRAAARRSPVRARAPSARRAAAPAP